MPKINGERLLADLRRIADFGRYESGVHRPHLSRPDGESRHWLMGRMKEAGLEPTIDGIGTYLASGGGKRLRPALLLLSSRLLGYDEGEKDVRYAAVIEFIHTATLVHDDIIDEARLRRGRTSAHARWGNNLTVLFGD